MNVLFTKRILPCCLLVLMSGSGCSRSQIANKPYPLWGESIRLPTEDGKSRRYLQVLEPSQSRFADACILIVHGMNEHSGRYRDIARHFADRYRVAGIDMTAHGLSNPVFSQAHHHIASTATGYDVSDAYLEQAELNNLDAMRRDIRSALIYLTQRCDRPEGGKLPLFILSHSLGSLVSASYLLDAKNDTAAPPVQGIIFTGPAFAGTEVPGWRGWFQNPLIRFTFHTQEHFLNPHDQTFLLMAFNQLLATITVPLQNGLIEFFSLPGMRRLFSPGSPAWVADYLSDWEPEKIRHQNDKYIMRRSILRYVQGVQKEIIRFRRKMDGFKTPYLLIYAEHDPITAAWGNVEFAAATLENHTDNEIRVLSGASHHEQLFSAPERRKVILQSIGQWLKLRIKHAN